MVVIQETVDSQSTGNVFEDCSVSQSGSDGIQIQGDMNQIRDCVVQGSGGYGIHLCKGDGMCVPPGTNATATENEIVGSLLTNNAKGAFVVGDDANGNVVKDSADSGGLSASTLPSTLLSCAILYLL